MIEFYQLDDATNEYDHAGTIEDGEITEGDLDWVIDFVEDTDDLSIDDEEAVVFRVSNEYLVGVIPDGDDDAELAASDRSLIDDTTPDFDAHYLRLLEGHAWHPDTDRALIADTGVPEAVQARLREAILGGALFSDFDTIPSDDLAALRQEFVDMLDAEGWTTDSLTEQLQDFEPSLSDAEAERIARTETASVVNTAREEAYEDRGLADDQFKWVSQADDRRTDACEWLTEQTADGVTMDRLKELIEEAPSHDADMADDLARPDNYVVHPNERSTWVRHVE